MVFGFCYIDKYLNWYQRLLSQTLGQTKDFRNINIDHCVGKRRYIYSQYKPLDSCHILIIVRTPLAEIPVDNFFVP